MNTSPSRVLIVEDSESFRKFFCSVLGQTPEFEIVGEVTDGLEAVQKARELQPDLILLDLGLPSLNGIEAARQIRKSSAGCRILFVSQETSAEVVREALAAGGQGYIVKTDARRELLDGVNAVLRGDRFAGKRFSANDFGSILHARAFEDRGDDVQPAS